MDKILELIDNVKEKLTDNEYKQIMDELSSANDMINAYRHHFTILRESNDRVKDELSSANREIQTLKKLELGYLKIIADLTRERLAEIGY
jgi:predicted  nucleic acid-binding Zn-ribbon protein